MTKDKKHIDEFFRSHLKDLHKNPSASLWKKLNRNLQVQNFLFKNIPFGKQETHVYKRTINPVLKYTAAAIVLLAIISVILLKNKSSESITPEKRPVPIASKNDIRKTKEYPKKNNPVKVQADNEETLQQDLAVDDITPQQQHLENADQGKLPQHDRITQTDQKLPSPINKNRKKDSDTYIVHQNIEDESMQYQHSKSASETHTTIGQTSPVSSKKEDKNNKRNEPAEKGPDDQSQIARPLPQANDNDTLRQTRETTPMIVAEKEKMKQKEIIIPNVFTPNGDGINDNFVIENLNIYDANQLIITDRYGQLIFDRKNYSNTWDGDGFPEGVYYYILLLESGNWKITKKGVVHILR